MVSVRRPDRAPMGRMHLGGILRVDQPMAGSELLETKPQPPTSPPRWGVLLGFLGGSTRGLVLTTYEVGGG